MGRRAAAVTVGLVALACIAHAAGWTWTMGERTPVGQPVRGVVALILAAVPLDDPYHGQLCGAVLVDDRTILTAAHCVVGRSPERLAAIVGADNLCRGRPIDGQRVSIERVIPTKAASWPDAPAVARSRCRGIVHRRSGGLNSLDNDEEEEREDEGTGPGRRPGGATRAGRGIGSCESWEVSWQLLHGRARWLPTCMSMSRTSSRTTPPGRTTTSGHPGLTAGPAAKRPWCPGARHQTVLVHVAGP